MAALKLSSDTDKSIILESESYELWFSSGRRSGSHIGPLRGS
jgi:hypothetical protein